MTQSIWREDNPPHRTQELQSVKSGKQLYKVTKIRHRMIYDVRTGRYTGDYEVERKQVDYRINKGAVTIACKYAVRENQLADKMNETRPGSNIYKYEIQVEVCDLPEFKPATFCEEHGVQPLLTVPGLANEPTCLECI
jgi:hypothetical protein